MAPVDFEPAQAASRFRRLQQLARHYGLDGILLVPGVDGKYGRSTHAVGYLLEGRSNRDTLDVNKLADQLEDAVVLVTPGEVQASRCRGRGLGWAWLRQPEERRASHDQRHAMPPRPRGSLPPPSHGPRLIRPRCTPWLVSPVHQ